MNLNAILDEIAKFLNETYKSHCFFYAKEYSDGHLGISLHPGVYWYRLALLKPGDQYSINSSDDHHLDRYLVASEHGLVYVGPASETRFVVWLSDPDCFNKLKMGLDSRSGWTKLPTYMAY